MLNDITTACEYISSHFCSKPETALILGTGLNSLAEKLTSVVRIPYQEIPGFSPVTAPEHKGMLITGKFSGQDLLIMQGRYHYYEGYSGEQLIFPVRVLKQMGIRNLIVTNAAGSLNQNLHPGMLVIIKDHINLMGTNPLIGLHDESLGERFPSMNEAYNRKMISQLKDIAQQENIEIREGIYAAVSGPSLETKAECLMLQRLGADLVGMSTVPEVIAGVQSNMRILGISVVTNMSNIFHEGPHNQDQIRENAQKALHDLEILLTRFIKIL